MDLQDKIHAVLHKLEIIIPWEFPNFVEVYLIFSMLALCQLQRQKVFCRRRELFGLHISVLPYVPSLLMYFIKRLFFTGIIVLHKDLFFFLIKKRSFYFHNLSAFFSLSFSGNGWLFSFKACFVTCQRS